MSNACKNSLLIIVAVIVCAAVPLLGNKAFAQSKLFFPVTRSVSYTAPNLESVFVKTSASATIMRDVAITAPEIEVVFAGHSENTAPVKQSSSVVKNLTITTETTVYIEEVATENTFLVRSELHFPVRSRVSYTAPDLEMVFSDHPSNTDTVVKQKTAYTAPNLEVVFNGHTYDNTLVVKVNTDKKNRDVKNVTGKQKKIARKIVALQMQIATLKNRIASPKESIADTADDFGCGSCGTQVKNLQKFLNRNSFTLATTGAGSVGQETSFFGPRTLAALKQFQSAYNIPTTGVVNAQTRNLINNIEYNALGKITATDCVTAKKMVTTVITIPEEEQKEAIRNDQTDQNGEKNESGNFFTRLFKKIVAFLRSLFRLY